MLSVFNIYSIFLFKPTLVSDGLNFSIFMSRMKNYEANKYGSLLVMYPLYMRAIVDSIPLGKVRGSATQNSEASQLCSGTQHRACRARTRNAENIVSHTMIIDTLNYQLSNFRLNTIRWTCKISWINTRIYTVIVL